MGEFRKLKQPLNFEEQLEHLIQDKNLRVLNKRNALDVLKRENYYRLSGYWIDYVDEDDHFFSYITFEKIYSNYKFDKFLRGILIEVLNDVEVYFKTRIANYHTIRYGPDGYLLTDNFRQKAKLNHEELMHKIENLKIKNPNNLIINHHNRKYGGIMPLWVVVELLSFGNISKLFTMLKNEDKKAFVKSAYKNISYIYIESFYHALTYFRNQCCHYQRLYSVEHTIKMNIYKTSFYDPEAKNCSTFYFIYVLRLLNPNHDLGERFIYELLTKFKETKVDKSKYGFPYEWKKILMKANGYCINPSKNPAS